MKRWTIGFAALLGVTLGLMPPAARAATSVGVNIQVGDPYRGGEVVFVREPDVVVIPATRVYYVPDYDYDVYRYGSYWYFIDDGFWYRARSYRGPFVHVTFNSVPRAIRTVPVNYRRHWKGGPPPHAVARGYYKNENEDGDHQGRGHHKH